MTAQLLQLMLIENIIRINQVNFTLSDHEMEISEFEHHPHGHSLQPGIPVDKWRYSCECGKYKTPSFAGKKSGNDIPEEIEAE